MERSVDAGVTEPRVALCVEDDARMWRLLADEVARHGLAPRWCPTVAAARSALVARPALALVDLGLPDGDGLDVVRALRRRWSDVPAVVLSVDDRPARILAALRDGAHGYVLKEDLAGRLPALIDEALSGALPLSPRPAAVVRRQLQWHIADAPDAQLTAAEVDVLQGLAVGLSYEQCATRRGVSVNTVRTHVRSAYRKLDVTSKTEAVLAALRLGLIEAG